MSRINNKNVQIGDNYVLPLENSSISKYEARVESILSEVEEAKRKLLAEAKTEADNIKMRAELIVKDAEAKAQQIIQNAENQAKGIVKKAEDNQQNVKNQTDEISKQAYDEGFLKGQQDGLQKFKEDSINAIKSLETLSSASFDIKHNIVKSADMDIVELVIAIARKITTINFDEKMLKEITIAAINHLKDKEEVTIIVNPQLVQNIVNLSEEFKNEILQLKHVKIIEDSALSVDGTIVSTPLSRIDSRISSQIDEIASRLKNGITDDVQQE